MGDDDRQGNLSGAQSRNTSWRRVWAANTTNNSALTAMTATPDVLAASKPENSTTNTVTNGRFFIDVNDALHALFQFFGTDAADETFAFQIFSWRGIRDYNGDILSYQRTPLYVSGVGTLGAETGVANGSVTASELYADTITGTDRSGSAEVIFNEADGKAALQLDVKGSAFVEVEVTRNGQTAATIGVLYTPI